MEIMGMEAVIVLTLQMHTESLNMYNTPHACQHLNTPQTLHTLLSISRLIVDTDFSQTQQMELALCEWLMVS